MKIIGSDLDLRIFTLRQKYAEGKLLPSECVEMLLEEIRTSGRPEVWIARVSEAELLARARGFDEILKAQGPSVFNDLPLLGMPFAVKDNIDVAGMQTTAGCPAFAYSASSSSTVVSRCLAAGAILIGKTNLDQFATGLIGTRSPYGVVRNAIRPEYVSGGSSSGSAVAVALNFVSFSLGTDTAGSGRVPAGLNDIVGLKPTPGLISNRGVVPACRTLDCVSVFARSVPDAWTVLSAIGGYDDEEPYSKKVQMLGPKLRRLRIAIPDTLEFYGDTAAGKAYEEVLERLRGMPDVEIATICYRPFLEAAMLLYSGPWVAERLAAIEKFFHESKHAIHPVVAGIIGQGSSYSAVDAFNGQYRLAALRRQAEQQLQACDLMIVPTAPTIHTIAAAERDPVQRNSELGFYTNFVNFFEMSALSIPGPRRADGLPFGITLIGLAGADHRLAVAAESIAAAMHGPSRDCGFSEIAPFPFAEPTVHVAVVGAHLQGQPLNWQLTERSARKVENIRTSARYELYKLEGSLPPKPGLQRVPHGGRSIEIEVWEMPTRTFGEFVADVPPPLAIGSLELEDGRWVKGFVCENIGLSAAENISRYGGWRSYIGREESSPNVMDNLSRR